MSLFDVFDALPVSAEPDKSGEPVPVRESGPAPRIYPCAKCSNNYSVVPQPTGPPRMICDPCGLPTNDCTCERIPYARVP